ncbi:MAG: transposase [Acidimicrobiia bacterium]
MKARTAAANQLHSVCDTAPDRLRAQLRGLTTRAKVKVASRLRPGDPLTPTGGAKRALVSIAHRWAGLDVEVAELDRSIKTILDTIAAPLLARHGVGYETAGALLCTAGDNPDRLATESSFASLCGTAPVPVSTGNSNRRRLNRAGDHRANSTLWTIVMVRLRSRHAPTVAYLQRRVSEGHSKRDAIRCLKRFVAREVYEDIQAITATHAVPSPLEIAA